MRRIGDIIDVTPLVEETLTTDEVIKLIKLGFYDWQTGPTLLDNITYISWDGDKHYGVLVSMRQPNGADDGDYFMERTYKTVQDCGEYWLCKPVYHKLLPVVLHRYENHEEFGRMPYLVAEIMRKCYFDNIIVGDVKGLEVIDVTGSIRFEKSKSEIQEYRQRQEEFTMSFVNEDIPAGDERWDNLLFGDKKTMYQVFDMLRDAGHHIKLDGEKDSFGWVTCGIVMDGELMTSEYF